MSFDFQKLVYESKFRGIFPEFSLEYTRIDALGGATCKSCNRGKIRKLISRIKSLVMGDKERVRKLNSLYSPEKIENVKDSITVLSGKAFKLAFLLKPVRDLFKAYAVKNPEKYERVFHLIQGLEAGTLSMDISQSLHDELYRFYDEHLNLQREISSLLKSTKLIDKIFYNKPRKLCKIFRGTATQALENSINEFGLSHDIHSVSLGADKAVVLYTLIED